LREMQDARSKKKREDEEQGSSNKGQGKKMEKGFRGLKAWQVAYELGLEVYKMTKNFPKEEQYCLTDQMRRSAISVFANIAEGYEREYQKEYAKFLLIAKGSLGELEGYLLFAKDLKYLNEEHYQKLDERRQEAGRLIKGLIRSLAN
jgi:four helix bundle protein